MSFIIAVPPLRRKIKNLAKKDGLTVVEGRDSDEVVEKIESLIEIDGLGPRMGR
jgi:hypothetical protein